MKDDHEYDALKGADHDSGSNTEVEELEQQNARTSRRHRRNHHHRRRGFFQKAQRWNWVLDIILLLVIFGLLAEKIWETTRSKGGHAYEFAGDLSGFAPRCMY